VSIAPFPSRVAIPEDADFATVLDFLESRFPRVGRDAWRSRLDRGLVLDESGRPVTAEAPCRPRTRLRYFREVDREPRVPFREQVIYRDEHLLVVDKPHFLPVVPAGPYVNECLVYRLRRATGEEELTPVHRLDRVTAGLVLCSVRRETRTAYARLFAERRVEKEYLAVARMPSRSTAGTDSVKTPRPGRRWVVASRLVRGTPPFLTREAPGPPNALTRLELLARDDGLGLFRALPATGKKHQIRFHLASLGFPILHERYSPELLPKTPVDFDRPLQLLALRLAFRDPFTGESRVFVSRRRLACAPDADGLE
jgi:tRNA pseudouridine32 synthase/23S rRNA pseudouridine746 synthase